MSAPTAQVTQDDDGPEEGEIQDDEDDIVLIGGCSPPRSSTTSTSVDIYPSPTSKDSYERDIRNFELRRARGPRSRGASGGSKNSYTMGSSLHSNDSYTRTKSRNSKSGLTHGKENRHVHRYKSPVHHRKRSHDRTLADFKDTSPPHRDSSCSSIDSEERPDRSSYHRSSRGPGRSKRKSSSSPEAAHIPVKRRSHHSAKCPLIKILHSVAKETRLIAMETSENNPESSSLRQRLFNMGAMTASHDEIQSSSKSKSVEKSVCMDGGIRESSTKSLEVEDICKEVQTESTQTEEVIEETEVVKPAPELVTLTDSEDGSASSPVKSKKDTITLTNTVKKPEILSNSSPTTPSESVKYTDSVLATSGDEENDDDIGQLRLIALQSKKNEPLPIEESDVLQLRLEALKTAFMKKFKTRKKMPVNSKTSKEGPLSPLDEIPLPLSPASPDEVMTPVDMELAETDDEADSVHSSSRYSPSDPIPDCYSPSDPISDPNFGYQFSSPYPQCYSPSDPTGSPTLEPSLQDLLPPPPPPDLELYLSEQNFESTAPSLTTDNGFQGFFMDLIPPPEISAPPPLPPYFRELLSGMSDMSDDLTYAPSASDSIESQTSVGNGISLVDPHLCQDIQNYSDGHTISVDNETTSDHDKEERTPSCNVVPLVNLPQPEIPKVKSVETISTANIDNPIPLRNISSESVVVCEENPSALKSCHTEQELSKPVQSEEKNVSSILERLPTIERTSAKLISSEEEEILLRQRLIQNMANKRNKLIQNEADKNKQSTLLKKTQDTPSDQVMTRSSGMQATLMKRPNMKAQSLSQIESTSKTKLSSTQLLAVSTQISEEKRFIINLGEDSDSCEDYPEAEALGLKCSKNKESWLLHMKEMEANPPKILTPVNKAMPLAKKVPSRINVNAKPSIKDIQGKKVFAENLADLESSVERFLKGVRFSHEAKSSHSSKPSSATPVAVKHLPVSQQEEYRRLKMQIARLERQREMSNRQQKQGLLTKGTQLNSETKLKSSQPIAKTSNQSSGITNKPSDILIDSTKTKGDLKAGSVLLSSGNTSEHSNSVNLTKKTAVNPQTLKVSNSSVNPKGLINVVKDNHTPSVIKIGNIPVSEIPQNQEGLKKLQSIVLTERSHVSKELSSLEKLLSQVDKSLDAQARTATEVSSLIEKLCVATGHWKAQNRTVTTLVQRVAQRQRDLSAKHRSCVAASKSCVQLGCLMHGKNYRIPFEKADSMCLQLKKVHEKTQELAKRRAAEQTKQQTLEKQVANCLLKLCPDSQNTSAIKANNAKKEPTAVPSSPSKIGKNNKSNPVQVPAPQPPESCNEYKIVSAVATIPSKSNAASAISCATNLLPHVNSEMISRAISHRLAQNKVKSAKAVLNFARKRCFPVGNKQKKLNERKRRSTNQNRRDDLSDMDISTDGEETERKNKYAAGDMEVVDMSVSPDTSSSPPEIEKASSETNIASAPNGQYISAKTLRCADISSTPADDTGVKGIMPISKTFSLKNIESQNMLSQSKTKNEETHPSSKRVLNEYISPLGGLSVFSSSVKGMSSEGDCHAILCPYDLNGVCQDSECSFKHQHR